MFNVFLCFLIKLLLLLLLLYLPKPCTDMLMVHNQCFHFMGVHLQDTVAGCVLTRVFLLREEHFSKNGEGVYLSKLRFLKPISPPFITTV